jgi:hypothetical protein
VMRDRVKSVMMKWWLWKDREEVSLTRSSCVC